jgi:hypothetical protein
VAAVTLDVLYVVNDATQNIITANKALLAAEKSRNIPEKTKGAKTKPFLIHCLGRINLNNPPHCIMR